MKCSPAPTKHTVYKTFSIVRGESSVKKLSNLHEMPELGTNMNEEEMIKEFVSQTKTCFHLLFNFSSNKIFLRRLSCKWAKLSSNDVSANQANKSWTYWHHAFKSWNIFYLQICVCGVSSTLSPLYWNDDPKKSSPTLTPLNSAALSMWETPILLRYSFFLTVAPLPRTMPGNTSSQSIPCLQIFNRMKNKQKKRM